MRIVYFSKVLRYSKHLNNNVIAAISQVFSKRRTLIHRYLYKITIVQSKKVTKCFDLLTLSDLFVYCMFLSTVIYCTF